MKNIKRKIRSLSLALVICVVVTALTGCFSLQELKEKQACFDDEGNLCVGNYKYIEIEIGDELHPDFDEFKVVYVSEEEIPLLLTPVMGTNNVISDDEIFIEGDDGYYCREDQFESVQSSLNKKYKAKGYEYKYFNMDKEILCEEELSAESSQIIKTILRKVKETKEADGMYGQYEGSCTVHSYGDSKYLTREEFDIEFYKNRIYFVMYPEDGTSIFYKIPNNYHAQLREIFDKVLENTYDVEGIFY